MSQHKKNISVKCKILLKNICMIHSYLFLIRYLKFMLKRRTASAGFFSQSGTINHLDQITPMDLLLIIILLLADY
ncbi:hypothetical protein [Candidatus Tisiphia endosymbiont of Parasteatoda lunata]|uniref:hypothetical protein n=1 Tax=Candidatus Tisiphia endosymbiont of Parasteatoda lunata TaxID=3066275 RepID=UPI00313C6E38